MNIRFTNNFGQDISMLLVVVEHQPHSTLAICSPDLLRNGGSVTGGQWGDVDIVVSFQASGTWYQAAGSLNPDITLTKNALGQAVLTAEPTTLVMSAFRNDMDIRHEAVLVKPSSPKADTISLQLVPATPQVTLDMGTGEKTFWFVVQGSAARWGVTLDHATFQFSRGENWNADALNPVLSRKGVGTNDASGRTLFYSVPDAVVQALKDPNNKAFNTNPGEGRGPLTLEYTLGVKIDPEVEMGGPGTGEE